MAYYGKDLAASFRTVRGNTIQIAEEIPEDKYSFKASPETRTIGQALVHIALGPGFQSHIHGKRISDLQLPEQSLIILTVDEGGAPKVPTPDTAIQAGDEIVAVTPLEHEDSLRTILTASPDAVAEEASTG